MAAAKRISFDERKAQRLSEVQFYAEQGVLVLPVKFRGKEPLNKGGFLNASMDEEQLDQWFGRDFPGANIGLVVGKGFDVIDIDSHDPAVIDQLVSMGLELPHQGPVVATARGMHLYVAPMNLGRLIHAIPHVDFLTNGYVLGPTSVHPDGTRYRNLNGSPNFRTVPEMPKAFLDQVREKYGEKRAAPHPHTQKTRVRDANDALDRAFGADDREADDPWWDATLNGMVDDIANAEEGERNETLNRVAFRAARLMRGSPNCPWDEDEVRELFVEAFVGNN